MATNREQLEALAEQYGIEVEIDGNGPFTLEYETGEKSEGVCFEDACEEIRQMGRK